MWCILLILLPIALLFAESFMNNLQSVSIVAAFPIGAVIVMIAISFMKDAKKYMKNLEKSAKEKGENRPRLQQESRNAARTTLPRGRARAGKAGVLPVWFDLQCGC